MLLSVRVGLNPGVFESKYAARYTGHDISFKKKKIKELKLSSELISLNFPSSSKILSTTFLTMTLPVAWTAFYLTRKRTNC